MKVKTQACSFFFFQALRDSKQHILMVYSESSELQLAKMLSSYLHLLTEVTKGTWVSS